ncbi:MAG: hypothetical protein C0183_12365 [Roseiflexus castenholzii]|nr:MAG: hypothetical protein C0183_12365 [Roseiflexus castenholzii]
MLQNVVESLETTDYVFIGQTEGIETNGTDGLSGTFCTRFPASRFGDPAQNCWHVGRCSNLIKIKDYQALMIQGGTFSKLAVYLPKQFLQSLLLENRPQAPFVGSDQENCARPIRSPIVSQITQDSGASLLGHFGEIFDDAQRYPIMRYRPVQMISPFDNGLTGKGVDYLATQVGLAITRITGKNDRGGMFTRKARTNKLLSAGFQTKRLASRR